MHCSTQVRHSGLESSTPLQECQQKNGAFESEPTSGSHWLHGALLMVPSASFTLRTVSFSAPGQYFSLQPGTDI
jgi:hypothetical protein